MRKQLLPKLGLMALSGFSIMMIVFGHATAQEEYVCTGPTKNGCTDVDCTSNKGGFDFCNKNQWDGYEIESFQYRYCSTTAGTCSGYSPTFTICAKRFYEGSGSNWCVTKKCQTINQVPGCAP